MDQDQQQAILTNVRGRCGNAESDEFVTMADRHICLYRSVPASMVESLRE
jgi:hypothetical protein